MSSFWGHDLRVACIHVYICVYRYTGRSTLVYMYICIYVYM